MVRLYQGNDRGNDRAAMAWKTRILGAAVIGILPILSVGCAQNVKQTAEFGKWRAEGDRPVVLSGKPVHDTLVHQATEEQLTEADWRVLESLGPKAI